MLCGKTTLSHAEAVRGVTGENEVLHSADFAGRFARWLAVLASHPAVSNAKSRIESLYTQLESYDMLDQIEVVSARLFANSATGKAYRGANADRRLLRELALKLPASAIIHIRNHGLPLGS